MVAPLIYGAGVALMAAARVAVTAAPAIIRGAGALASRVASTKLTLGGATALAAAPAALSFLDNEANNVISESLLKTPFAGVLEKVLEAHEWAGEQKATVVSNTIMRELEKRGAINRADEHYDIKKQMADVMGHLAVGDEYGAANAAAKLGIEPSDAIEAYNTAKDNHPDASFEEQCNFVFENLIAEHKRKLAQESQVSEDADQQRIQEQRKPAETGDAPAAAKPTKPAVAAPTPAKLEDGFSGLSVSAQFEKAADNAGFFKGMILNGISALLSFNKTVQNIFQSFALGQEEILGKYANLEEDAEKGNILMRAGGSFMEFIGFGEPEEKLAHTHAPEHN